ncbi:MAG: hypothetical protein LBG87_01020, partial [Spirochaetaceae bacterium]|nr:hypothetical protein [Spirochaetaceae bacterium]
MSALRMNTVLLSCIKTAAHFRFLLSAVLLCLYGCASPPPPSPEEARPEWADQREKDDLNFVHFYARSVDAASRQEALDGAAGFLRQDIAQTIFSDVHVRTQESTKTAGEGSEENAWTLSETELNSDVNLSGIKIETYAEEYLDGKKQKRWRAWAYARVSRDWLEREAAEYKRNFNANARTASLTVEFHGDAAGGITRAAKAEVESIARGAISQGLQASRTPLAVSDGSGEDILRVIFYVNQYPETYGFTCYIQYDLAGFTVARSQSRE